MELHFLTAADNTPLVKHFFRDEHGNVDKNAYPLVLYFDSHPEQADSLEDFCALLKGYSERGACLLKGRAHKKLKNESRAGATTTTDETDWICLDIDKLPGTTTPEQFVQSCLPEEFHSVSYIWQPSSSMFVEPEKGLSGHIFMRLDKPYAAPLIKLWLTWQNLNNDSLAKGLSLSKTGRTLTFALDITVCQNDKLIYLARPQIDDDIEAQTLEQFRLVEKTHDTVKLPLHKVQNAAIEAQKQKQIDELRRNLGLKVGKREQARIGTYSDTEILENPEVAVVTGRKEARGWIYLNINGGDSWGYYHKPDGDLLYNFKGEPIVRLADFLPEYWREIQKKKASTNPEGKQYLGVWQRKTDVYWTAIYDPTENTVDLAPVRSKDRLKDFLALHGRSLSSAPPQYDVAFEPNNEKVVDHARQFINLYEPSPYIRSAATNSTPASMPPTIQHVMRHALGGCEDTYHHFMNWLAFIYQKRKKALTSWVIQGTQGTGKGLLFNRIIRPTLGARHCNEIMLDRLKDQFNSWEEHCLLCMVDEAHVATERQHMMLVEKLKNMITEEHRTIRRMQTNPYEAKNYINLIFASNEYDAVRFNMDDRRYNVAPRQEKKLYVSEATLETIDSELQQFTDFLMQYPIDEQKARQILENEARDTLRLNAENSVDRFFRALREGDLEFFTDFVVEKVPGNEWRFAHREFTDAVIDWIKRIDENGESKCCTDEVMLAYAYIQRERKAIKPNAFGRMLSIRGFSAPKKVRIGDKTKRGLIVEWDIPKSQIPALLEELQSDSTEAVA